jgi:hypothetical protein
MVLNADARVLVLVLVLVRQHSKPIRQFHNTYDGFWGARLMAEAPAQWQP